MKRVIFTFILAVFAWLTYINIFNWTIKVLTACVLIKLLMGLLAIILSFATQKLLTNTPGSLLLKDKFEELADLGSIYTQTTKLLLILFIFYCLYKCQNITLLWCYASSTIIDNFISFYWVSFIDKINNA